MRLEDRTGVQQHGLALAGQGEGMRVPHDQPPADRRFELADMIADRGLGKVQPPPGLAETGSTGDGDEGLEPLRLEHSTWLSDLSIAVNSINTLPDKRQGAYIRHMKSWLPDRFILALLGTVAVATLLPATGAAVPIVAWISNIAIGLLFFL